MLSKDCFHMSLSFSTSPSFIVIHLLIEGIQGFICYPQLDPAGFQAFQNLPDKRGISFFSIEMYVVGTQ